MKKLLLFVVAVLCLSCGLAMAAQVPIDPLAMPMQADQFLCVVSRPRVAGVMELPRMANPHNVVPRSDMRVASAGMVFNRTADPVLHWNQASS